MKLAPAKPCSLLHGMPSSWKYDGTDSRGHTRIICAECGRFIAYQPPDKPHTANRGRK